MSAPVEKVPVLIVGGGPIGLALAADLGRRGVETLLVEQNEDAVGSPKMIEVSVRSMEFCRQLGLSEEIRNWGFPLDYQLDSAFVTTLTGWEIGRIETPSLEKEPDSVFSPERNRPCPQTWFDPILQKCARGFPSVTLEYRTRLESFIQDEEAVVATVSDLETGAQRKIRADYLVGCDGAGSTVRDLLGIAVRGEPHLDLSMSVYVRIPRFMDYHDKAQAYRYVFIGTQGTWAVLTTIDGRDLYRLQLIGVRDRDLEKQDLDAALHACMGCDFDYMIEDVSFWVRKMVVADRFQDGRVFLAGDSAHAHPPNGGLGMNTGIQDAFDLGWKLAARLEGWGGPTLLESYDYERRPASSRAAVESLRNFRRLTDRSSFDAILDDTEEGERLRIELGRHLEAENEKAWHPIGVHLGYIYNPSPITVPDGTPMPEDDRIGYEPMSFPGARAPHVWIEPGKSILDLFGISFVLLRFGESEARPLEEAAKARSVPLVVEDIRNEEAAALYGHRLVLVRPDGHVAWRGYKSPANPAVLIDTIRGAGPRIAACRSDAVTVSS